MANVAVRQDPSTAGYENREVAGLDTDHSTPSPSKLCFECREHEAGFGRKGGNRRSSD